MLDHSRPELTAHQANFKRVTNACTYSHKDLAGGLLWVLLFLSLWFVVTSQFLWAAACMAAFLGMVANNPIKVLYAASCLLTAWIRTPEFLPLEVHFPSHHLFLSPAVKCEILGFLAGTRLSPMQAQFKGENNYLGGGGGGSDSAQWRFKLLKMLGEYSPVVQLEMPTLFGALQVCPDVVSCAISVLEPGVTVPMHVGYYKGLVRYMLPILVPRDFRGLWLNVNGLQKHWEEGKDFMWDDLYPHAVYNTTSETRVVLFMDIRRAQLPAWLDRLNSAIIWIVNTSGMAAKEIRSNETAQPIPASS